MPRRVERNASASEAAERFGVSRPTVTAWIKRGCPRREEQTGKVTRYWFDLAELAVWLEEHQLAKGHGGRRHGKDRGRVSVASAASAASASEQLTLAKVQQALLDIQKRELQLAELRSELLRAEDVERERLDRVAYARAVLLGGPTALGQDLAQCSDAAQCEDILRDWLERALRELSGGN